MTDQLQEVALIVIPETDIMTAFTGEFSAYFEPRIDKLRDRVASFQKVDRNPQKPETREEIKAFARKLVKTRTTIEATGKALADRLKALPKKNDENRRLVKIAIEQFEADVLAPVNAWETAEKARVDAHVNKIELIQKTGAVEGISLSVDAIMLRMNALDEIAPKGAREEFADEYSRVLRIALDALGKALIARRAYDAQMAELAALRQREAERAAQEAEWKAAEEAERAAKEAIERQAREAEAETRRAQERAAAAEREAELARQKAEAEALAAREGAERRRLETEAAARKAADDKAAEDRRIAEAKAEAERVAAERKAKDKQHRAKVNREAAEAIARQLTSAVDLADVPELAALLESCAKMIVVAIAKNEIPGLKIEY